MDSLNLGLDDTAIGQQAAEVFVSVPVIHYALTNAGVTPATIRPRMKCSTGELTGNFYFIDTATTKKNMNDIKLSPGESAFINVVMQDSGTRDQGYPPTAKLNTCEIAYVDKYRFQALTIEIDDDQAKKPDDKKLSIDPISLGGIADRWVDLRQKYCPGMVHGISLGGDPVDCLFDSQILGIDPVYLWENALDRVLKQAKEFRQMTDGIAVRTPGLILTDCKEPNCGPKTTEMLRALRFFTPKLAVWLCPGETPDEDPGKTMDLVHECERHDFPVSTH